MQLYTRDLFEEWWAFGKAAGASDVDLVATFTEYTARTIVDAYVTFCPGSVCEV
jgi:hypothetical protein